MSNDLPSLIRDEWWVGLDVNMSDVMEDGDASSVPESVEVSEGEGGYENVEKQEDEDLSGMGTGLEEDSSVEQQGANEEELSQPGDPTKQNPLENIDGIEEEAPALTSEAELEQSSEILDPDDDEEASGSRDADEPGQEAIESFPSSKDGDRLDLVPTDVQSPKVDGAPPTTDLKEEENLESGSEDKQALPEIADGPSQPPAPDLPLGDKLDNEELEMKVNQYGGIENSNGEKGAGESTESMKLEEQITDMDLDNADNGVEQEMKTLNDGLGKKNLKDASEIEELRKEQDPEPDMDSYHIVPNRIEELQAEDNLQSLSSAGTEDHQGDDVPRDLDSQLAAERNGTSEFQPPETVNSEIVGEASSDSALRSLNSEMEESQKRAEDLNQLTQEQAKQLEDVRHQLESSTAQLKDQSKIHEELKRDLQVECDERLKSETKLMMLDEILPQMEEKLKNLSNQVLFLEGQLQEQVDLRNKVEDDVQQKSKERMQYVTQLKEQVDVTNKLAEALEQERKERTQYFAQLEEQTRLHEELAHKLDEEQDVRLKSEADLMVLREILSSSEEKLKDLRDEVESISAQLLEQTELRKGLEEKLDRQSKERMQHMTKIEEQNKIHEELTLKLEDERDERLKSETSLKELREGLTNKEEELKDLHHQVVLLTTQLQEQVERKNELEDKLDHQRDQRMEYAVMASDHPYESLPVSSMPWSEEKLEFAKLLDEQKALLANQVLEAEKLKNAAQMKVGLLNHQVQNLEALTDIAETMEHVFSAKDRAIKQALWTVFQAVCLGMGFMYFVVAYRDPLRSSLQPT